MVCQPMVMMLFSPRQCEETRTIGPGSRYRRARWTGKSRLRGIEGMRLSGCRFSKTGASVAVPGAVTRILQEPRYNAARASSIQGLCAVSCDRTQLGERNRHASRHRPVARFFYGRFRFARFGPDTMARLPV